MAVCLSFSPFGPYLVLLISSLDCFFFIVVMDNSYATRPSVSFTPHNRSPYSVIQYISRYSHNLNARRLKTKRIVGNPPSVKDHWFDKYCDTTVGDRLSRWCHCGDRRTRFSKGAHESTDLPFARCYGEVYYDPQLCPTVSAYREAEKG